MKKLATLLVALILIVSMSQAGWAAHAIRVLDLQGQPVANIDVEMDIKWGPGANDWTTVPGTTGADGWFTNSTVNEHSTATFWRARITEAGFEDEVQVFYDDHDWVFVINP